MVKKADVEKRIHKALSSIHMTGVKGHSFTMGETIASLQTRYEAKDLLKDARRSNKALDAAVAAIESHDISKAESKIWAAYKDIVRGIDEGYRALFNSFILLLELLHSIALFEKKHKLGSRQEKELFGATKDAISKLLHQQLARSDAVYAAVRGRAAVALIGKEAMTSDNYITMYLRMKLEVKKAFRNEKKLEALLEGKKVPKNFAAEVKKLSEEELDKLSKFMTDVNLKMKKLGNGLNKASTAVSQAIQKHELPASFGADEAAMHNGVVHVFEQQAHSVHIFINQIHGGAKRV